jgi:hypothetical protein
MKTLIIVAFVGTVLGADDPPPMKDGLWISHSTIVEGPANKKTQQTHSLCVKRSKREQTRVPMPSNPPQRADCKLVSKSLDRKGMRREMECVISGQPTRMTNTNTIVILSENEQTQTTESAYNPPMHGIAKITTVLNLKYQGACPAEMANGDIMSSDGKITHPFAR